LRLEGASGGHLVSMPDNISSIQRLFSGHDHNMRMLHPISPTAYWTLRAAVLTPWERTSITSSEVFGTGDGIICFE